MMMLFCLASRSMRACAVVAVLTVAIFSASARETKFLAHGWDCQSAHPDDVLASAAEFDKTPLDGISLSVRFARSDGVVCSYKTMISDPAWRWEDIKGYVPTLRNIELTVPGGGTAEDAAAKVPEKDGEYPESFMFDMMPLPAYGFWVRHADAVRLENVRVTPAMTDARPCVVSDDATVEPEF